ncbi:unnamed protein product [Rotaria sp. Silwood2]|nr:unnamed protein product [Rotaria sp. Silwood2]CAF4475364.1 unnamed protein product [Rotaria sp. Silwood2]
MKYPNMEIGRSKFFSLRPTWVRERTPHESYKYNIHNLTHHHQDFQIEASCSFSSSGHGKGPCDGVGAVVKSTTTQHLLKDGSNASFSTSKQFFEWCVEKNDRMVVARSRRMEASNWSSTYMFEPNHPLEVRWLSADVINNEFENRLMPRWNLLFSKIQMNSSNLTISQITVTYFDPPFPASIFNRSKSPRLFNLTISTEQFRARLIDNP